MIEIIPVETLTEVLEHALVGPKKDEFIKTLKENKIDRIKDMIPTASDIVSPQISKN
jgi:Lon-like ATP-dependent protease